MLSVNTRGSRCNILTFTIFHNLNVQIESLTPFRYCPCMLCTYLIYHVLHNPEVYTNILSISQYPFCVLENGGVSECYTDSVMRRPGQLINRAVVFSVADLRKLKRKGWE